MPILSNSHMTRIAPREDDVPLRLIAGTVAILDAELAGDHHRMAQMLGIDVIVEWPPIGGEHDGNAARYFRQTLLNDPASARWLVYYVDRGGELVASAGFFGPPVAGVVEIGYSVCLHYRRQGIATSAIRALVDVARSQGVQRFTAHVRPDNEHSIRALQRAGFEQTTSDQDSQLMFTLDLIPRPSTCP
ncbi:hypothetical protein BH10ACT2_BH10ACT2_19580 [soil metagenome]